MNGTIMDEIRSRKVFFDGGMGSLLQARGLKAGELPETWNLLRPEVLRQIHRDYLEAGCDILTTNTFGANGLKYPPGGRQGQGGGEGGRPGIRGPGSGAHGKAFKTPGRSGL